MLWNAPGHAVGRWRNVLVQVRTGEMTVEALGHIETAARLTRAQLPAGEPFGALLVIAEGAQPPVGEAAKKQREVIASLARYERLHLALVLEGRGAGSIAQRAIARVMMGAKHRTIADDVNEAVRRLLAQVGGVAAAAQLLDYVESLRALSRR